MFHLVAELLAGLAQPLAWVAVLLAVLVGATAGRARLLASASLALVLLTGWQYPADVVLRGLEQQVAPYAGRELDPGWLAGFDGVVVLGGALQPARMWTRPGQLPLQPSAERLVAAARLARLVPQLTLVFSGGEAELPATGLSEAERARRVFDALGLPPGRVRYEDASRDTWENAVETARLPGIDARRRWLLLSSAAHLPRALAAFRHAGWNVTPYPVDFRAPEHSQWWRFSWAAGPSRWQFALHEWIGLLAYRLRGIPLS